MYNECRAKCFLEQSHKNSHVFHAFVNDYIDVGLGKGGVGSSGLGFVSDNGGIGSNLGWRGVSSSWSSCTMGATTCPIGLQPKFQLIYNKTSIEHF